jgi:hypothetical protein
MKGGQPYLKIPPIQSFINLDTLVKCAELCSRQYGWITQHIARMAYNIVNLDQMDTYIGKFPAQQ